jgi:hypothetical protein
LSLAPPASLLFRARRSLAAIACFVGLLVVARVASADPPDPLLPLIHTVEGFFHRNEIDGITRDARYALNPSEVIRLSIVSQLLGYYDLYVANGNPVYHDDIVSRADFLVAHFDEVRSGTAFDGMLGYALLGAYEVTGNRAYLTKALVIVDQLNRTERSQLSLNGGLMAAMCLAKHYELTGNLTSRATTDYVLGSVALAQNHDGSFPHFCSGSTDIHYTGWMGMELVAIRRCLSHPSIDPMLRGVNDFLRQRVGAGGATVYEQACDLFPGCYRYFYSKATGCRIDYDTRAWINELGYSAVVFDHFGDSRYQDVMAFLYQLAGHGSFPDKWSFYPLPNDPIYPWGVADVSVIRSSVVFWSLASMFRDRYHDTPPVSRPSVSRIGTSAGALSAGAPVGEREPHETRFVDIARAPEWPVWNHGWTTVDSLLLFGGDEAEFCTGAAPLPRQAETMSMAWRDGGPGANSAAVRLSASPNPARSRTDIEFELGRATAIAVTVFDVTGRRVREWPRAWFPAGRYRIDWDLRDQRGVSLPRGLYLVRLDDPERTTRKVLIER